MLSNMYKCLDLKLQAKMPTKDRENFLGISSGLRL